MAVIINRLLRVLARRIRSHFTALVEAEARADYPICRERRLWRRLVTFIILSCAILLASAWYTNRVTYYWWKAALALHGPGAVSSPDSTPVYLRADAGLETVRQVQSFMYTLPPRAITALVRPIFLAAEAYVQWIDAARFVALVAAIDIVVYLATWTPLGEYIVCRYLLHTGLSGRTYTVFTAVFVRLFHLLGNLFSLYISLYACKTLSESGEGLVLWNLTVPKLFAYYTIAGGFGYFVPNFLALIFARHRIANLPPGATVLSALPSDSPTGLMPCLGASPAICALSSLWMLSETTPVTVGIFGFSFRLRALIIPSLLIDLPMTKFAPVGVLQHLSGALFGVLYYYFGMSIWDLTLTAVGNRRALYERQPVDTVLPDGKIIPSYHLIISD